MNEILSKKQLSGAGFNITDKLEDGTDCLCMGFDTELTFKKLEDACILLGRGVDYIATNPDWVCPTEFGYVPDCGSVSEMLFNATKRRPYFIGKPRPDMAYFAMEKAGCEKAEKSSRKRLLGIMIKGLMLSPLSLSYAIVSPLPSTAQTARKMPVFLRYAHIKIAQ